MKNKYDIKIFVMPVGACSYEKSWQYAKALNLKYVRNVCPIGLLGNFVVSILQTDNFFLDN